MPPVAPRRYRFVLRYAVLLVALAALAMSAFRLQHRGYLLRTQTTFVANPEAIATIARQVMPAQATEIRRELLQLRELGATDLLLAVEAYASQQRLAEALGEPADRVATIGAARDWFAAHPTRTRELTQRALRTALEIAPAPPERVPPLLGRDGNTYNLTFAPAGDGLWRAESAPFYLVVMTVRNRIRLPVRSLEFAVMPRGDSALPAPFPARSVLQCQVGRLPAGRELAPDATMLMSCGLMAPFLATLPVDSVRRAIRELRARSLQPWIKDLGATISGSTEVASLELHDSGLALGYTHGPSAKTDAGFASAATPEAGPPRRAARATSCSDRGDCERERLAPFEGLFGLAGWLISSLLPGYLVAGLAFMLARPSANFARGMFITLALLAAPWSYQYLGGAYGMFLAPLLVIGPLVGYWLGYALGRWAVRLRTIVPRG